MIFPSNLIHILTVIARLADSRQLGSGENERLEKLYEYFVGLVRSGLMAEYLTENDRLELKIIIE